MLKKIALKILMSLGLSLFLLFPLQYFLFKQGILEFSSPHRYLFFAKMSFLNFGVVFFSLLVFPILEKLLTATFQFKKWTLLLEVAAIFFAYLGPAFTSHYPFLMVYLLPVYVLIRLGFFHAKWDWLFFLLGGILGSSLEMLLVTLHSYQYLDAYLLGIPYWLPLSWGIVAISVRRFAEWIENI